LNIVFVAAGLNTRYFELSVFPKILLPINNKSILKHNIDILGEENNYFLIANSKYKKCIDDYINVNKISIKILYTKNSNGSYNSIFSVVEKLPQKDVLFIWSDLLFLRKEKFLPNKYPIVYLNNGNYSYHIDNNKSIRKTFIEGNVPGIYYFPTLKFIFYKIKQKVDLINAFKYIDFNTINI
jgi:hypothetical protein